MELDILVANIAKVCLAGLVLVLLAAPIPQAMGETNASLRGSILAVTGHVKASHADASDEALEDDGGVVAWLVPAQTSHKDRPAVEFPHYRIVQRDKTFKPRLLVIPAGSTVDFPNNDQWFHNVFSISRGRQFDLGLYEAGVLRSVRFDRAGVSYLFCSIHPEMMAVVVTVDSTILRSVRQGAAALPSTMCPPGNTFFTSGARMPGHKCSGQHPALSSSETITTVYRRFTYLFPVRSQRTLRIGCSDR